LRGHRQRYRQIVETLSRHGVAFLATGTAPTSWVPFHRGWLGHQPRDEPYTRPDHVRLALEELGPTFVKLGQIASTRPDLLPHDYVVELVKLQDAAPPVPGEIISQLVREELGSGPDEAFAEFDLAPLASASIGQAHAARLPNGTNVVVKVRRPDAVETVTEDLEILDNWASHAAMRWDTAADFDVAGVAEEFAETLRSEMDYLREGRNAERFAANFASNPEVHIPRVFWQRTTSKVLTLERIDGIKVDDLDALDAAGIDRRALAVRATGVACKMIFEDGFFHADPHAGNLFVEPGGRIGIIDFGMVGEVDDQLRGQLGALLLSVSRQDADAVTDAVLTLAIVNGQVDRDELREDLAQLMAQYEGHPIGEIPVGPLIKEMLDVLRRHHLRLPRQMALLLKMLIMVEGMGAQLDPQFHLGDVLGPYAQRLVVERFSAAELAKWFVQLGSDAAQIAVDLPELMRRLTALLDRGGFDAHLRADELEPLVKRTERIGDRLVAAMILSAVIDALAHIFYSEQAQSSTLRKQLRVTAVALGLPLGAYVGWTNFIRGKLGPRSQ
jgi:ubiquinone biosynthesis protein